ncbi:MAG TPA: DUF5103 domain-containing protein [Chryseolinea sp.]|nr:DUF5103 domain-containing protein [Chryseolinea sp.]
MRYTHLIMLCIALATSCTPIVQSSTNSESNPKVLRLTDFAYEPEIKTVELSPEGFPLLPAVTRLGVWNLVLRFDDLRSDRDTYYARIIHCNYDWTKSDLQDLDYLTTYNEFPINNSEFSVDTHIPYVHYGFLLPPVKLPGNYVVMIYRGSDKEDIVITRRFMVYENLVAFNPEGNMVGSSTIAAINQQLNFTVSYKNLTILNPLIDVHVNIRQNQRWDNIATDVRPSITREIEKELTYRFFDEADMFRGGNEFRFFDLRSLNNPGQNVGYVAKSSKPYEVYLAKDKSRTGQAYGQYNDMNGGFVIDNYDYRDLAFTNYANVTFNLSTPRVSGDVYVNGAFNYWNLNEANKMEYDSSQGMYKGRLLLKQGWYDYQYLVKSSTLPPYYFEGSHFETENKYEILIYNRPFQPRADILIGYFVVEKNPRR